MIILTEHAKIRMAEKAITCEQIKRAIKQGATVRQTDGFLAVYAYLEVAYTVRGGKYIIKTVKVR
ncbi:Uncharacterised protein [uncultured archaeon]|nr:Uncharacterised protein [uncultured archaeon]